MRLLYIFILGLFVGLAQVSNAQSKKSYKNSKPNILFIFADDQTFESIGAYGKTAVKTPNLDRLVKRGVSFSNAYNMGSNQGAVCISSRSMLISGTYVNKATEAVKHLPQWGELMRDAGYRTYIAGKWHVKAEPIFDVSKNIRSGMPKQHVTGYNRPKDEDDYKNGWKPWDTTKGGFWKGGKHWSEVLADDTIEFMDMAKKDDKPFFMYLAFNAPHDPRQAPKEYVDMYPIESMKVPGNFIPKYPYQDEIGCGPELRDARLAPFPRTPYAVKVNRQEYYAAVTYMDHQIGRMLDALDKSGMADNTYIVFTADHGLAVGHHGLIGKQNMYEHSMRPPFILVAPKSKKKQTIETPIYLQDIMPTALELAGASVPEHVQFKSLLPLLEKRTTLHYESIYGKYMNKQRMIVKDGWKLIAYPMIKKFRLYNLSEDPEEMNDLSDNPSQSKRLIQLKQDLVTLMKNMDDTMDLDNPPKDKPVKKKKKKGKKKNKAH